MIFLRGLWSVIAWTVAFALMAVVFLYALPFAIFGKFTLVQRRGIAQMLSWVPYATLSRVRYTYHPDYDPSDVSIYVQNHISMLDAHIATGAIPALFCGLENAAHFHIPIYGWIMKMGNGIPVLPRSHGGRTQALTDAVAERKSRGISVLTFPEGHRTLDGKVQPFRRGAFFMARNAGLPVVPVAVRGLFEVLPKGTWIINPGQIDVYVGPQISTEGLADEDVEALAVTTRDMVQDWVSAGDERMMTAASWTETRTTA